jgi:hypothetical protein
MVMVLIMVMVSVLTGRGIDLSTTWFTMIAATGLAEYDSSPQISS